jgi:hypothetical protein
MIANHAQFLAAILEKKKVSVRFYSKPDSGVLDLVCAPMEYGLGSTGQDGLNRYWFWDSASSSGSHTLGLVPQQIVDLRVLGENFDPAQFIIGPQRQPAVPAGNPPAAAAAVSDKATVPIL